MLGFVMQLEQAYPSSVEALEVLQSFGTGHDGSFSTGHANSAKDMLSRLETMALMAGEMPLTAIRSQIASGVDIVIHLGRLRDGSRKLLQIMEVEGMKEGEISLRTIYEYREDCENRGAGQWIKKGVLLHQEKLKRAGLREKQTEL